jgi:hypothetical protein
MKALAHVAAIGFLLVITSDGRLPQPIAAPSPAEDIVPPLERPSGPVVRVSTEGELQSAVANLMPGQTILIAHGTYRLRKTLYIGGRALNDVAIRGDSDRREDVVLVGPGMTNRRFGNSPFGIWTGDGVNGILIANLTIRDFYSHPIIFNAGTRSPHVYNVALADGGEQLLKSNPNSDGGGVDDGIVEYSLFAYSSTSRDDYTNAIDVHAGANWIIRHNRFVNIRAPLGQLAGPAILMWRRSTATIVDSNVFVNCQREISFGLEPMGARGRRDAAGAPYLDHSGGIIKNNMIVRDPSIQGDVAILIAASPNTQVLHNTILMGGAYPNAIEYRFATATNVRIANNLTDRAIVARDGANASLHHNLMSAERHMFVDPRRGDLHLLSAARVAIDRGEWMEDAGVDWDGDKRPIGSAPDLGADEIGNH